MEVGTDRDGKVRGRGSETHKREGVDSRTGLRVQEYYEKRLPWFRQDPSAYSVGHPMARVTVSQNVVDSTCGRRHWSFVLGSVV